MCNVIQTENGLILETVGELRTHLGGELIVNSYHKKRKIQDHDCLCCVNIPKTYKAYKKKIKQTGGMEFTELEGEK